MAASIEITPDLLAGFFDEAAEHLEALNRCLLAFEKDAEQGPIDFEQPEAAEQMNETFRAAHSLKGLTGVFGFDHINRLTHRMETLFDEARMGRRSFDSPSLSVLLDCTGVLETAVEELQNPSGEPTDVSGALGQLDELLASSPPDGTNAPSEAQDPPGAAPPGPEPGQIPQTVLEDPALRQCFIETTEEAVEDLSQKLLQLEKGADEELLNSAFRTAHSLKGACGAAGLDDVMQLTHRMESFFEQLRSGQRGMNDSVMEGLLGINDRLRQVVELVRTDSYTPWSDGEIQALGAKLDEDQPAETPESKSKQAPDQKPGFRAPADMIQAAEQGFQVLVAFREGDPERELQAYVILNKLKTIGDVIWSMPDVEGDALGDSLTFEFLVRDGGASQQGADQLQTILKTFNLASADVVYFDTSNSPGETVAAASPQATPASPTSPSTPRAPATSEKSPAGQPPASRPAAPKQPVAARKESTPQPKANVARETIRVDVERLDELMNLGGELVINRARFTEVVRHFRNVFDGKDLTYMADEIAVQLGQLGEDIQSSDVDLSTDSSVATRLGSIAHDFGSLHQLITRVHEARPSMYTFDEALNTLERISGDMQKRIMETRMVPVGPLFQRFRRLVRDMAKDLGKKIELVTNGESTELDKKLIDELSDPLTHIIRNSADHGIELPEERIKMGKPPVATVTLSAYHQGNSICIDVLDDGKGIDLDRVRDKLLERELASESQIAQMSDHDLVQYIFHAGFSTAKQVSDLSGRGMGMDIVKTKLASLNGTVEVETTAGKGTAIRIRLPLTLAIIRALQTRIGGEVYSIPLETVAEIIGLRRGDIQSIHGQRVARVRERVVPVCRLDELLDSRAVEGSPRTADSDECTIVIIEAQSNQMGLVVDELIGQEDIVIKSLAENYRNVSGFAGATIMGDGRVALILDVAHLLSSRGEPAAQA